MSDQYKHGDKVPSEVLCKRLNELSDAVTEGRGAVLREFDMRVPAELDRDADIVLSEAASRIADLEAQLAAERERVKVLQEAALRVVNATDKARKIYGGTLSFDAVCELDRLEAKAHKGS
tara:strand:- start:3600 stop:3959 length:360 start_codon:yes stop_codon:yes gene_type:complete